MIGLDPRPFTFGELWGMLEAAEVARWDHTASLIATVVGLVQKGAKPEQFNPYRVAANRPKGIKLTSANLKGLKAAFKPWKDPNAQDQNKSQD